jgi:hypothetical protein
MEVIIMDIWDITACSGVWKPDDGCRVWACIEDALPQIPPYFQQTHRNAVFGRFIGKGKSGKVSSAIAQYSNAGRLQWNDVYHAKAVSVPLTDGQYNYPKEQWCYEGINGIHATLTTVFPNGLVTFLETRYYNSFFDRNRGRCVVYGPYRYWECKVRITGEVLTRFIQFGPDDLNNGDSPVRVSKCSKGLEQLIGTAIGKSYIYVGSYNVPTELYQRSSTTHQDILQGLIPLGAPYTQAGHATRVSASLPELALDFSFLLGENGLFNGYGPLGILQSNMVRNDLLQRATLETMDAIMTTWDNGIQNLQGILELGKLLKQLKDGDFSSLPKRANDLWLQYRYVFSTSKMDAEEAVRSLMRKELKEKIAAGGSILVSGESFYESDNLYIKCRCHMRVKSLASSLAGALLNELDNWGMIPDTYLVWDMIPYSFIVDWFVPIGDALAVHDANQKFSMQYQVERCMYSFAYTRKINGIEVSNYSRWVSEPVIPQGFTFMVDRYDHTSSKTIFKRIVDTWAILGR